MNFSVLMDAVYNGKNFIEGLEQIKAVGYNAFEFASWWDKDLQAIQAAREKYQLYVSGTVTKTFELTDPARRREYIVGLGQAIAVAQMLGCNTLFTQGGSRVPGLSPKEMHQSIVDGLKACIPLLQYNGIMLVVEPVNTLVDHPNAYLNHTKEAFEIIDQVGSPHVKVLYDIYHMQVMEGNIIDTLTRNIHNIGHFHIAGVPGRHEPYTGELYYINILKAIQATGFQGYIGLEFYPLEPPAIALQRFRDWVRAAGLM
ncbi:hydroxypyruvate isomerase family protein [Paenibacillus sp. FSL H8-0034]|uniref:hydroxypyruvate isomerase family protein n=1 Tax=Paenibacillus sp. FSL H8-0034 TaxID=2954671 RepID=UPI0030F750E8